MKYFRKYQERIIEDMLFSRFDKNISSEEKETYIKMLAMLIADEPFSNVVAILESENIELNNTENVEKIIKQIKLELNNEPIEYLIQSQKKFYKKNAS